MKTYIEKLNFVIGKFEDWYSEECPYEQKGFCPNYDALKQDHDREMEDENEEDRWEFAPSTDSCGYEDRSGWCWARYYEKMFDEKEIKR